MFLRGIICRFCRSFGSHPINSLLCRNKHTAKPLYTGDILHNDPAISEVKTTRRNRKDSYAYINCKQTADIIAKTLCDGWGGYILEANPGPGKLALAILETGHKHLRLFERNAEFKSQLKDLVVQFPFVEIFDKDLFFLKSSESRIIDGDTHEMDEYFSNILSHPWENEPPFRLVSVMSNRRCIRFLRYLLAIVPTKSSLFSYGRCEFFFLLPESEYMYLSAEPKMNFALYRWNTVLYNLFFDIEYIHKFLGSEILSSHKTGKNKNLHYYFVRFTPKSNIYSSMVHENKLKDLYFFVRHGLIKRTGLVIPTMEEWVPFCGPRLIKEGMNMFTKFGDLSPKEILELFNQFSKWPEYEDTNFYVAMQKFYDKRQSRYMSKKLSCDDSDV